MTLTLILNEVHDSYSNLWWLRGGRVYGLYATVPIIASRPCDIDLLNDIDLHDDLDLVFE